MVQTHKRRAVLGAVVAASTIGLGGCSGDSGPDGESNSDDTDSDSSEGEQANSNDGQATGGPMGVVGQFQVDAANTGVVPDATAQSGLSVDWQYPDEAAFSFAGLTYGDGQLYTAIQSEGGDQRLLAIDPTDGTVLTEQPASTPAMPVYRDGSLYVNGGGRNRSVRALSPRDFTEQWSSSKQLGGTELTVTDDAIYGFAIADGTGVVRSLSTADGTHRWDQEVTVSGFTPTQPVAVGEESVFAAGDVLNAFARSDGSEQWTATADGAFTSPPLVADGTVYVGTENDFLKGYAVDDGSEELSVETPTTFGIENPLAYADNHVFGVGSFSTFAVDIESERLAWGQEHGIGSAMTVAGDHLLGVQTSGTRLVAVNWSDGRVAWKAGPDAGEEGLVGGARVFAVGERVFAGFNGRILALS